jgi:hypothetical protein
MNKKHLKIGMILKCRPDTIIGYFPYNENRADQYIVVRPKSLIVRSGNFYDSSGEVLIYVGEKKEKVTSKQMSLFESILEKNLAVHEVLWRGSVFRIRESTLKYVFPLR